MGMGFAPTWLRQVSPLLHKTTLTTANTASKWQINSKIFNDFCTFYRNYTKGEIQPWCVDTIHQRDGQTDGQTLGDSKDALTHMESRGKILLLLDTLLQEPVYKYQPQIQQDCITAFQLVLVGLGVNDVAYLNFICNPTAYSFNVWQSFKKT